MYDNIKSVMIQRPEGQGVSIDSQWRSMQPGHIDVKYPTDASKYKFDFLDYKREITWDGTFNQPLGPLADKMHKDARKFW